MRAANDVTSSQFHIPLPGQGDGLSLFGGSIGGGLLVNTIPKSLRQLDSLRKRQCQQFLGKLLICHGRMVSRLTT